MTIPSTYMQDFELSESLANGLEDTGSFKLSCSASRLTESGNRLATLFLLKPRVFFKPLSSNHVAVTDANHAMPIKMERLGVWLVIFQKTGINLTPLT